MDPTSLIFVVVVGVWLAYFIPYWVRRREHMATARSVDRFSEAMRVLSRSAALTEADLGASTPKSYAVSPARVSARRQVTVKRADSAAVVDREASHEAWELREGRRGDVREQRGAELREAGRTSSRKVRGITLLASLLGLVLSVGLAAFSVVPWLVVGGFVVAVVGSFLWLRSLVQAQIRARRVTGRRAPAAGLAGRAVVGRAGQTVAAPVEEMDEETVEVLAEETVEVLAEATGPVPMGLRSAGDQASSVRADSAMAGDGIFTQDGVFAPTPVSGSGTALVDEDDIPLTWDPRPVPRPTYTMKAKADPAPLPAISFDADVDAGTDAGAVAGTVAGTLGDDAMSDGPRVRVRRAAGA